MSQSFSNWYGRAVQSNLLPGAATFLIFACVSAAVVLAVWRTEKSEEGVRIAQVRASALLRLQLDEEDALRGYADTRAAVFLKPYRRAVRGFPRADNDAHAALAAVEPHALASLGNAIRVNAKWLAEVARPLINDPGRADRVALQIEGKELVDHFRRDIDVISQGINNAAARSDEAGLRLVDVLIAGGLAVSVGLLLGVSLVARHQRRIADAASEQRRLYERERAIADKLRDAIIVPDIANVPGLSIHARYRPADEPERVGGDWYDLFPLANGRLFVVVGDVVGHGIDAALSMSRVRNAIIAGSLQASSPGDILTATNRQLLTRDSAGLLGTAVCALLDPSTGEVQCACAGHPPPLLLKPDVPPQWMCNGSLPLGVQDCQYSTITAHAEAGSLIIFYTDGLTEITHNLIDGQNQLFHAAREAVASAVDDPAAYIEQQIARLGRYKDDVAIVTVCFTPAHGARRATAGAMQAAQMPNLQASP
jgi:serine phosphatase RsbU (regulator of sigma subunit)